MSSTTNSVGAMLTYMNQSTAAVSVSSITELKTNIKSAANTFSNVLGKTSDALLQAKDTKSQVANKAAKQGKDVVNTSDTVNKQSKLEDSQKNADALQKKAEHYRC